MGFILSLPPSSSSRSAPSTCEYSDRNRRITRRQLARFAAALSFSIATRAHAAVPMCTCDDGKKAVPTCSCGNGNGAKPGIFKEGFANAMEVGMDRYEEVISGRKKELFSVLSGSILDIGLGTGPNLKYMPVGSRVIGLEPNRAMWPYARKKADALSVDLTLLDGHAENIQLPNDSVDNVVCTLTLCSVENPGKCLGEIVRVLKPGASFIFIEHIIASEDEKLTRLAQNVFNPLQKALADGCNLNRDTEKNIREAPLLSIENIDRFPVNLGGPLDNISLIRTHVAGIAKKKIA